MSDDLILFDDAGLHRVAGRLSAVFFAMGWQPADAETHYQRLRDKQNEVVAKDLGSIKSGRVTMLRDSWHQDGSNAWLSVLVEVGDSEVESAP